ncbi:uncharacterized protein SCHCODRAFT_02712614 [Schizophyllum commune H4-8]|uniref:uncharacterized protein n=1 Tax=Schizophyllum commune (strain H4-8 / FGSC 9210) TaxID=578458 RepID=UPI00215E231A|nr:uncharacterized protein SCHCODRAFT_02712614 [Schizophyllum commune H4-8]KAI5888558.1 hypothetical protein SCHCODRAFT_02712614 [Schizophyllum commune H4-8]
MSQPFAPQHDLYNANAINNVMFDPSYPPADSWNSFAMGGGHGDDQELDAGAFWQPQGAQAGPAIDDPSESLRRLAAEQPAPGPILLMTPPTTTQSSPPPPETPPGLSLNHHVENTPAPSEEPRDRARPELSDSDDDEFSIDDDSDEVYESALDEAIKKLKTLGDPVDKDEPGKRSRVVIGRKDIIVATYGKKQERWRDTWRVVRSLKCFEGASLAVFHRRMEEIIKAKDDFDSAPAWLRKLGDGIYIDVGSQIENIKGEEQRLRNASDEEKARRLKKQEEDEVGGDAIRRQSMRRRKRAASDDDGDTSDGENRPPKKRSRQSARDITDELVTMNDLAKQVVEVTLQASEKYDKAVDRLITVLGPHRPENALIPALLNPLNIAVRRQLPPSAVFARASCIRASLHKDVRLMPIPAHSVLRAAIDVGSTVKYGNQEVGRSLTWLLGTLWYRLRERVAQLFARPIPQKRRSRFGYDQSDKCTIADVRRSGCPMRSFGLKGPMDETDLEMLIQCFERMEGLRELILEDDHIPFDSVPCMEEVLIRLVCAEDEPPLLPDLSSLSLKFLGNKRPLPTPIVAPLGLMRWSRREPRICAGRAVVALEKFTTNADTSPDTLSM